MWFYSLLRLSHLERLLIDEGEERHFNPNTEPIAPIADQILGRLSARSLARLSQVSKIMNIIIDRHVEHRWNIIRFLSIWFQHPRRFVRIMGATNALICGDNVTRFFRECVQPQDAIDIYITPDHAYHMSDTLAREGYQFHLPGDTTGITFGDALDAVMASYPPGQFLCDGERSIDPSGHGAHYFTFKRDGEGSGRDSAWGRVVVVQLVRCEPYRHVLAQHSTAFMDHITSEYAVCPFARSSLVTHNSFLARGSHVADPVPVVSEGPHRLIPTLNMNSGSVVPAIWVRAGPPKCYRIYRELSIGKRYMGDRESLLIPVSGVKRARAKAHAARYGPRFNVADFRTPVVRRPNAYLLISEPGIN